MATVVKRFGEWWVEIIQDHQRFLISGMGCTKAEARWFRKMFLIALQRHDQQRKAKP